MFPLAARREERGLAGQVGVGRAGRGRCLATGDPAGRGGGSRSPQGGPPPPFIPVPVETGCSPPPVGSAWLYEVPAEERVSKREEEEGEKKKKYQGKDLTRSGKSRRGNGGCAPESLR